MKAYIITIILSTFFAFLAETSFKKNNKKLALFFLIISGIIPCFIAGIRNEYVGRDIHNYLSYLYDCSINKSNIVHVYNATHIEPLFIILVYLTSLFKNINIVFFFIQVAITLPIYYYAYLNRKDISITFIVFIYFMSMYCYSLSMMRQSIAISLCLLSTYYYTNKNYKKGIFLNLIAFLFHRTAILGAVIYILSKNIFNENSISKNNLKLFLFIVISLLAIILSPKLISLLPSKYSRYLSSSYTSSVNILSIIKKIIWIFPMLLCIRDTVNRNNNDYKYIKFSFYLCIFDVLTYLIGIVAPSVSRISLYFSDILYFTLIPRISENIKPAVFINTILCSLLILFWWKTTTAPDEADVYPYKSDIVTILN